LWFLALKNTNQKFKKEQKKATKTTTTRTTTTISKLYKANADKSSHRRVLSLDDYKVVYRREKGVTTALYCLIKPNHDTRSRLSDHVITYTRYYALEYYVERGQSQ